MFFSSLGDEQYKAFDQRRSGERAASANCGYLNPRHGVSVQCKPTSTSKNEVDVGWRDLSL